MITLAPKKLIRTRRASEESASEPSLARRVSMCKDAKLSCRGKNSVLRRSNLGVARQLVCNHEQTGAVAPSENGRLPPVLAHQLASAYRNSDFSPSGY